MPGPAVAVLAATVLVAVSAVAMLPFNRGYYNFWINYDPQTYEEVYLRAKVTAFMMSTSGFFWGQQIALLLGAVLAQRLRRVRRALATAIPAAALLAAVNLAVAWPLSAGSRRSLGQSGEDARQAGLPFTPDLLDDRGFQLVLGAGLVAFPVAAVAGVGLAALIGPRPRALPIVAAIVVAIALPIGGLAASAQGEPAVLFALLALVPPAAAISTVVRTAVGDHGDSFTAAMVIGGAVWALLLVGGGSWARRRRQGPAGDGSGGPSR
jgi:hypothetical protein